MQRIWIYVLIAMVSIPLNGFPDRDARGNYTENFTHLQVAFSIKMERLEFKEGEDVPLEFQIRNFGKEVVRIFPALDPKETFQLQIRDKNNKLVPLLEETHPGTFQPKYHKDPIQRSRNHMENLRGEFSKEIVLSPGESFSYKIYLQEVYDITPNNNYTMVGYFNPNATESKKNMLLGGVDSEGRLSFMRSSNTIRFYYEPRRKEVEFSNLPQEENLQNTGISPEETVFLFLGAELKKNWANYFKWVNIPDYILAYDRYSGVYLQSSDREKEIVEEEFKKYLTTLPSGRLKYFKVMGVDNPLPGEARVKVYVERWEERIPTKYEYEYRLKKESQVRDSLWKIHGVVARVRK